MDPSEAAKFCTCKNCEVLNDEAMNLLIYKSECLTDAERELRTKRATVRQLRGEAEGARELDPLRAAATQVFDYWRSRLAPGAREFAGKRFDAVVARLRAGYEVDDIKRAIDGCAALPYVTSQGRSATGTKKERQDELELICRSEPHLRRFMGYAPSNGDLTATFDDSQREELVDEIARWRADYLELLELARKDFDAPEWPGGTP